MGLERLASLLGFRVEPLGFLDGGNGGNQVVFEKKGLLVFKGRPEHEDRPAGADFPDGGGFGDVGDGEHVDARLHETSHHLLHAVAVGVGFDNGDVLDAIGQLGLDRFKVAFQGGEIDFGPAAERNACRGIHWAIRSPVRAWGTHLANSCARAVGISALGFSRRSAPNRESRNTDSGR